MNNQGFFFLKTIISQIASIPFCLLSRSLVGWREQACEFISLDKAILIYLEIQAL